MRKLLILFATAAMIFAGGCNDEYDDSALSGRVDNLENRVAKLEELCRQMNTNISSLQTIVTALQNNDFVTGVTPITEGGQEIGYTITFSKSAPITIYHGHDGKDGVDGTNGTDGKDGQDGHTPVVGVRQDADGIYYWTLDGEWLLDNEGNKVKAVGRDGKDGVDGQPGADGQNGQDGQDGKDGVTPQLKIENGYWYVSTDGGATWTNLGKAIADNGGDGQEGGSSSVTVTQDNANVYFTLGDGTVITLPKAGAFDITFEQQEGLTCEPGGTVRIAYTIVGGGAETSVECIGKDGWLAEVEAASAKEGHIVVTAPTNRNNGKVLVFASSEGQTVMKSLTIGAGVLTGISDAYQVKHSGETLDIRVRTNLAYTVHVDEDSQSWISAEVSRAEVRTETLTVTVQPNPAQTERVGHFELRGDDGSMLQRVEIIQTAEKLPLTGCIEFFDDAVKAICVANFDTDKDGELSYEEAAAVTEMGRLFQNNSEIAAFDELQYFTSLTKIDNSLFYGCSYLLSVVLPEGLTEIGEHAFYGCSRLQSIRIPDSVNTISNYAFRECSQLAEVLLPAELKKIGLYAFENCIRLTELVLPDGVNEIGSSAFCGCVQLRSMVIPDGVVCISNRTFAGCESLAEITLPESLQIIEGFAFDGCVALREVVIPKRVKQIDTYVFRDCTALTAVTLPEKIAEINDGLFDGCRSLVSIELPQLVNTIRGNAFRECKSLKNIDLSRVTSIVGYAFDGCSALESIQLNEGFTEISDGVFQGCSNLASFKLPSSVTSIGSSTFNGCAKLPQQDLSHVESIGEYAFAGCLQWTEAVLPTGLTSVPRGLFKGCTNLTNVTISSTVQYINDEAFCDCKSLQTIVIPEGVNAIRYSAFKGCTNLTEVTIPSTVQSIESEAFCDCKLLQAVAIPEGVNAIGQCAFMGCSSLAKITVPKLVTTLYDKTFSGCSGLTEVVLSEGLQRITAQAFVGCTSLKSIGLPSTLTSIGYRSFADCTALASVYCAAVTPPETYAGTDDSFLNTPRTQLFVPKGSAEAYKTSGAWAGFQTITEQE